MNLAFRFAVESDRKSSFDGACSREDLYIFTSSSGYPLFSSAPEDGRKQGSGQRRLGGGKRGHASSSGTKSPPLQAWFLLSGTLPVTQPPIILSTRNRSECEQLKPSSQRGSACIWAPPVVVPHTRVNTGSRSPHVHHSYDGSFNAISVADRLSLKSDVMVSVTAMEREVEINSPL
jgi:hypothetical protein